MAQNGSVEDRLTPNYFEIGADLGFTFFFGDIDEGVAYGSLIKNNPAIRFYVAKNYGSLVSFNLLVTVGKTSGEKIRESVNQYFKANILEYSFSVGINMVAIFLQRTNTKVGVYANVGIGLIEIKSKLYDGIDNAVVGSYGYDDKSTTEAVIPVGLKVLYNINKNSSVSIQTTLSRVDTDKMDATVGNDNRDYYNFTSIGYTYKIYRKKDRSKFRGGMVK